MYGVQMLQLIIWKLWNITELFPAFDVDEKDSGLVWFFQRSPFRMCGRWSSLLFLYSSS